NCRRKMTSTCGPGPASKVGRLVGNSKEGRPEYAMLSQKQHLSHSMGFRIGVIQIALTFALLSSASGLRAEGKNPTCGPSDLKGDFATDPHGILLGALPPPLLSGPFVGVGVLHFDGVKAFAGTTSSSFGGFIVPAFNAVGTYSVTA